MRCRTCDNEITAEDKFCNSCGAENELFENELHDNNLDSRQQGLSAHELSIIQSDNKISLILGIVSTSLALVSYIIFGIISYITLGLSIYGLILAKRSGRKGHSDVAAMTLNIIAIVLSGLGALLMLLYWSSL